MPSKEIDKEQEKAIDQRPNYFAGQYLLEDDFQLEQKYHIDRQRRHNRLLHVSGIAEGLKVSKNKDWAVKVSAGTAIDSQGRQIILPGDQPVDLGKIANTNELKDSEYTLSIRYKEELTEKQDSEENTHRRVQEKPAFELSTSTTPDVIPIAKLIIKGGKVESIDSTERVYSGICLPTENGKEVTLRSSHGDDKPNLAVLTGSLSISGALEVKGESTLTGNVNANGSLTVKGNTTIEQELIVKSLLLGENENGVKLQQRQENQNLAVLNGSLSISGTIEVKGESSLTGQVTANGSLTVTGSTQLNDTLNVKENTTLQKDLNVSGNLKVSQAITPKAGATEMCGIMFPKDPYGGSGDAAWIRYYQRGNRGEACTLEIGIANDAEDHIALMPNTGNVGIGTNTPKEKLEVNGNIKANDLIFNQFKGSILGRWEKLTHEARECQGKIRYNPTKQKSIKRIQKTALTDGFVVAWIATKQDGDRGYIEVYVEQSSQTRGFASAQDSKKQESDAWIISNSLMVPVKKNEMWTLDKVDDFDGGDCQWEAYWISMGTV